MAYKNVFNRYETKYLITTQQQEKILNSISEHIRADEYGKSTICNLYYDTPDYLLIRRSMEKPVYKEKLRLRSYGVAKQSTTVFAEIKKKYDSVVYKRRISTDERSALALLSGTEAKMPSQITNEIEFFFKRYQNLAPRVFISYEREAFYDREDDEFRITFDKNILWRENDLSLSKGVYGTPILGRNQVLMEVKCLGAMPLWFVDILSENKLYKTSFSKYGRAYAAISKREEGGVKYA